jgi:hypothetical protein
MDTAEQGNESIAGERAKARSDGEQARVRSDGELARADERARSGVRETTCQVLGIRVGRGEEAATACLYTPASPIQRLEAVLTPCRPLERPVPGPALQAASSAQARARQWAGPGTGTAGAGQGRVRAVLFNTGLGPARFTRPVWKTLQVGNMIFALAVEVG